MGEDDKVHKNVIEKALGRMLYKKPDYDDEEDDDEMPEKDKKGKDCMGKKWGSKR